MWTSSVLIFDLCRTPHQSEIGVRFFFFKGGGREGKGRTSRGHKPLIGYMLITPTIGEVKTLISM